MIWLEWLWLFAVLAAMASMARLDPFTRGTIVGRKLVLNLVLAERGKAKVTVAYCRRRLPFLRKVSENTVRCELFAAGLAYLLRRGKTAVPKEFRKQRLVYRRWTLQRQSVLPRGRPRRCPARLGARLLPSSSRTAR